MDINPINNNNKSPIPPNSPIAEAASIVFNVDNKKIKIQRSKIKKITSGLAEIACSLGETNDPEEFAEALTDDIYESMEEAKEKLKRIKRIKSEFNNYL